MAGCVRIFHTPSALFNRMWNALWKTVYFPGMICGKVPLFRKGGLTGAGFPIFEIFYFADFEKSIFDGWEMGKILRLWENTPTFPIGNPVENYTTPHFA